MGFIKFNNYYIRADDENVNVNLEERYLSEEERDDRMDNLAYFMNRVANIKEGK